MILLWLRLLAAASAPAERTAATTTLLSLLTGGAAGQPALSDALEVEALGALAGVADRDLVGRLLEWLCAGSRSEAVATAALTTLKANADSFLIDLADRVVSSETFLRFFLVRASKLSGMTFTLAIPLALSQGLEELVSRRPLAYVDKILAAAGRHSGGGPAGPRVAGGLRRQRPRRRRLRRGSTDGRPPGARATVAGVAGEYSRLSDHGAAASPAGPGPTPEPRYGRADLRGARRAQGLVCASRAEGPGSHRPLPGVATKPQATRPSRSLSRDQTRQRPRQSTLVVDNRHGTPIIEPDGALACGGAIP